MKKHQSTCLAVMALSLLSLMGCESLGKKATSPEITKVKEVEASSQEEALVERGKYLVSIMDCTGCHSPKKMTQHGPEPDENLFLSGHPEKEKLPAFDKSVIQGGWALMSGNVTAFVGPWGTSFAANLTPDPTGIGNWSLENFKRAIREGKYKGMEGTRMIMPPMPWPAFKNLTDEDLEAVYEYLRTIKPVKNNVPAYIPPSS